MLPYFTFMHINPNMKPRLENGTGFNCLSTYTTLHFSQAFHIIFRYSLCTVQTLLNYLKDVSSLFEFPKRQISESEEIKRSKQNI